jgi:hypothetical protein
MIIERSIADVTSKQPKATNPRINSICERLSPTSLAVEKVGELDCTGSIKSCDASLTVVVVDTFCEGNVVRPLTVYVVMLGAISYVVVVYEDDSIILCGGVVGGGLVGISPTKLKQSLHTVFDAGVQNEHTFTLNRGITDMPLVITK